jgi:hypothetical protein
MRRRLTGIGFTLAVLAALILVLPSAAGMTPAAARVIALNQFDTDHATRMDLLAELETAAAAWHPNTGYG